jgi:hypothetical protein
VVGANGADQEAGQSPFLGQDRADLGVIEAEQAALGFGEGDPTPDISDRL